jgi:hypothetical protein
LATGLTAGVAYEFRVEARNAYGYSPNSLILTLLCAYIPEPPSVVTTTNNDDTVTVAWNDPITNGSPITEFMVLIRESYIQTYLQIECDNSQSVVSDLECEISMQAL